MSDADDTTTPAADGQYSEVSLRAVELLARAQRTADEAVAEAQNYARDLEASARAQYAQILQRAQVAARGLSAAKGGGTDAPADAPAQAVPAGLAREVDYVRTYARVAHAQMKTVLTALTDELDRLAAVAAGDGEEATTATLPPLPEASWPDPPERVPSVVAGDGSLAVAPEQSDDAADADEDDDGSPVASPRAATGKLWTREDAERDEPALSGSRPSGWRGALQRRS